MDHSFLAAADDLDKLLDDFEKNEEVSPDFRVTSHAIKKPPPSMQSPTKIANHNMNGDSTNHGGPSVGQNSYGSSNTQLSGGTPQLPQGTIYRDKSDTVTSTDSADFQLDLSEADFAPSPQNLPPNLSSLSLLNSNQQDGTLGINSQIAGTAPPQENNMHGNNAFAAKREETRYARSDSNTQLQQHDFTSYLPTNTDRTLSFGDLQSMNTSLTDQQETRYVQNTPSGQQIVLDPSQETSYAQSTPSAQQIVVDPSMTHGETLTQSFPRKEVSESDVLHYRSNTSHNSHESYPSSQRIDTSSSSAEKTYSTTALPLQHNSTPSVNLVHGEPPIPDKTLNTAALTSQHNSTPTVNSIHGDSTSAGIITNSRSLQQNSEPIEVNLGQGQSTTPGNSTKSTPSEYNSRPNVNSVHGENTSPGILPALQQNNRPGLVHDSSTAPGINTKCTALEQNSVPVVANTEQRDNIVISAAVEINNTGVSVNRTPESTSGVNTDIVSSEVSVVNDQQSTNVELSKTKSDGSDTTHGSDERIILEEDPQSLGRETSEVSTSLPDPKLMDEYVKQGARPKTLLPGSSPKHSPLKAGIDTDDSVASPKRVTPQIIQPEPAAPPQPLPTKTVIGFQSIDNITVTDADLDALEEEETVVPQGSIPGPNQSTGHLGVVGTMDDSGRLSPISKLLGQQTQPVSSSGNQNELTSMDPFYNSNVSQEAPSTQGHNIQNGSTRGDQPVVTSQDIQSSMLSGPNQQPADVNSTVPKPNANTNSQLNNSNSQLTKHGVNTATQPKGQVDSLLDMSNTALQGLTLAMNATTSPPLANTNIIGGSPQHKPNQGMDVSNHAHNSPHHVGVPQGSIPGPNSGQEKPQNTALNQPHDQTFVPPASNENGNMSTSASRTERSTPSAFQLPPPEDPPSYQEVREATRLEAQRQPRPKGSLRQNLSLDFEHPPPRKITAQPVPPSPIIEDATPESLIPSMENAYNDLVVPNSSEPVPSHLQDGRLDQPNGQVPQSALLQPGPNSLENADVDSRTSSIDTIETDSDPDGDLPPGLVPELSQELIQLGNVAPVWLPDAEATNCMMCTGRFTFRKRRHHCRACGKIFCSKCCSTRIKLKYMDSKEARVCVSCLNTILRAQSLQRQMRPPGAPDPRNPAEYCSTVPPTEQASQGPVSDAAAAMPPSVMVPVNNKSSLRRTAEGSGRKQTRHVRFSDGIHPGVDQGDLAATPNGTGGDKILTNQTPPLSRPFNEQQQPQSGPRRKLLNQAGSRSLIPRNENALPPIIITTEIKGEFMVEENPDVEQLLADLRSEDNLNPVVFVLNKNLLVMVKIVNLNCCVNRTCWCFSTKGMVTAGQDEIVIVLECLPDEKMVPKDIFTHLQNLYEEAMKGNTVTHMSHTICTQPGLLGSRDHGGFLYLQPTFQCLRQLILPESPFLFAVLLQKWETPWAKVFPLRLLLRLGAEFRYYPCPLMSVRFRKPVFGEIGHTIMNLLADFKNYQYLLPVIPGVTILMKDRETTINFPKNRYDDVMKVLNNSNEHVMALAANFSLEADSHLVCIQNDDGSYQTQAINIQNKPRKVTGASFVVFNGALKSSSGLTAKSSIVEDGLMVQIRPEMMTSLRQAIREMQNYVIPCKSVTVEQVEETVCVKWVEDDQKFNIGVASPIDGRSMEGIESVRIHNGTDFRGKSRSLRWTEVFFLENNEPLGKHGHREPVDLSKLAESLSMAFSVALSNHLDELREMGLAKLGLRVTIDTEKVGYEAGAKSQQLPPMYMNELDNELIPVLHNAVSQHEGGPVVLELVFHIIE